MLQFILRRLGLVIPTFIGITLLTFAFVHMIPGDPVMIMAGERGISPERHAQLLAELGLDKPMWQQYLHYIWGLYLAVFDPEGGKTGHAGQACGRLVRVVQVPQVADVQRL